jgi:hypothetical protein
MPFKEFFKGLTLVLILHGSHLRATKKSLGQLGKRKSG